MKRILLTTTALVLFAIASVSGAAQTRPATTPSGPAATQPSTVPNTRIAIVDTSMFANDKAGITRYLNAVKAVQRELQSKQTELINLQSRLKTIADDIAKLTGSSVVAQQSIQTKQEEGARVEREFKYKKEQYDADFEKRYGELVGPISTDIGKALDQFASKHGLTMILDITKLLPAVLSLNPAVDITQAFITEYNGSHP
jgi:Skp family chaperone for outer membrane proteins